MMNNWKSLSFGHHQTDNNNELPLKYVLNDIDVSNVVVLKFPWIKSGLFVQPK